MGRPPLNAPPRSSWSDYWMDPGVCGGILTGECAGTAAASDLHHNTSSSSSTSLRASCRVSPSKRRGNKNTQATHKSTTAAVIAAAGGVDYAALHDSFLDSLLQEQITGRQSANNNANGGNNNRRLTVSGSSVSSASSGWTRTSNESSTASTTTTGHKRQRGVLYHPPALERQKLFREPASYLHPTVRLQKDRTKGEPPGSLICAKGIDQCLHKLRAKMQLLTEHAEATVKRRDAILLDQNNNLIETRSLLILRMGFLSMTYGVLLRWDATQEKIALVVLRKNCLVESFYKNLPQPTIVQPQQKSPECVAVSVLYATGMNTKSHWTVQLVMGNETEHILLAYDGVSAMVPKLGGPLRAPLSGQLEIRLLEHRVLRRFLRCRMRVPLSLDSTSNVTSLAIPCPDGAVLQLFASRCLATPTKNQKRSSPMAPLREPCPAPEEDERSDYWDWICMLC